MKTVSRLRGRGRELAVLVAGLAAGAALLWAGATVHGGLGTAGEVAVARLASAVADTVAAEWERMLRADELPVTPAGEVFRWTTDARENEPRPFRSAVTGAVEPETELHRDPGSALLDTGSDSLSVAATLVREAERLELVEQDSTAALELVLEAFEKTPEEELIATLRLRALQLGARLGRAEVVAASWERLRELPLRHGDELYLAPEPVPARLLAWLALPAETREAFPSASIVSPAELEGLFVREDRLALGSRDDPEARFELAPVLVLLVERMGLAPPPLERRKFAALRRVAEPPLENVVEGLWLPVELADRPFFVRREAEELRGSFYAEQALEEALRRRSSLPAGFVLDLEGDRDVLGAAVRPRTPLSGSAHAFTLRHSDPGRIAHAESSRLKLLRGALLVLAFACAGGGFLTARVLARERKLGALRSAFVAGVSHDLRTPLASILLLAENLESGVVPAEGRARYHGALRKEAARLRRLVDDVLDFSRLERGESPPVEREELDLAALAGELADDLRARVEAAGRPFVLERGALPATALLDGLAVRRALENLVDNALKHGSGSVRLSFACTDGRLRLAVADEGPGVSHADRERVFEPFERLTGGANGHAGGTGLGLAIVRAVARGHGGEARVGSGAAGAGAVFEIELPLEGTEA